VVDEVKDADRAVQSMGRRRQGQVQEIRHLLLRPVGLSDDFRSKFIQRITTINQKVGLPAIPERRPPNAIQPMYSKSYTTPCAIPAQGAVRALSSPNDEGNGLHGGHYLEPYAGGAASL
jgi:hypothetical protein